MFLQRCPSHAIWLFSKINDVVHGNVSSLYKYFVGCLVSEHSREMYGLKNSNEGGFYGQSEIIISG